jgi:hypothetical protein
MCAARNPKAGDTNRNSEGDCVQGSAAQRNRYSSNSPKRRYDPYLTTSVSVGRRTQKEPVSFTCVLCMISTILPVGILQAIAVAKLRLHASILTGLRSRNIRCETTVLSAGARRHIETATVARAEHVVDAGEIIVKIFSCTVTRPNVANGALLAIIPLCQRTSEALADHGDREKQLSERLSLHSWRAVSRVCKHGVSATCDELR